MTVIDTSAHQSHYDEAIAALRAFNETVETNPLLRSARLLPSERDVASSAHDLVLSEYLSTCGLASLPAEVPERLRWPDAFDARAALDRLLTVMPPDAARARTRRRLAELIQRAIRRREFAPRRMANGDWVVTVWGRRDTHSPERMSFETAGDLRGTLAWIAEALSLGSAGVEAARAAVDDWDRRRCPIAQPPVLPWVRVRLFAAKVELRFSGADAERLQLWLAENTEVSDEAA